MSEKKKTTSKRVGLLYDSISVNTGDTAIGIAIQQALGRRNILSEIMNPFKFDANEYSTIIVGGGQLLRDPGDFFYDSFRLKGAHILNGVGVATDTELGYLQKYKFLSARTKSEAQIIQNHVQKEVRVLPCVTTLLQSEEYKIKGLAKNQDKKVIGIHLVPDVLRMVPEIIEIINAIPHRKVFIPFTHYNQDDDFMKHLPINKSNSVTLDKLGPLELHSVISQMDYVIVSSLHASIFAYSQNIPFISMFQQKTYDYFKDRRLQRYVYASQEHLTMLIKEIEHSPPDMTREIEIDRAEINEALDEYVKIIQSAKLPKKEKSGEGINNLSSKLLIAKNEINQLKSVVVGRDILMHDMVYQKIRSNERIKQDLTKQIEKLEKEIYQLKKNPGRNDHQKILEILKKIHHKLGKDNNINH